MGYPLYGTGAAYSLLSRNVLYPLCFLLKTAEKHVSLSNFMNSAKI